MSGEKDEDPIDLEEDNDDVVEVFNCKYCDFQTDDIDDLDEHIFTHDEALLEDNDDESEANNATEEQTEYSPPSDSGKSKRKSVEFSVKPPRVKPSTLFQNLDDVVNRTIFVCPYCSLQTIKKNDMTQHIQQHTSPVEVPIYSCSECSYITRRKCDMPKHLLTHCKEGNVPMYQCPQCSYATKRKGDLPKHLLCHRKPDVDELFTCNLCRYCTKRKGDLKKHLMSHERDPYLGKDGSTYNCSECGYTSRRLNDLHKHVVLHCDKLVTGVLKCTKCDYSTTVSNHFAKHVLSKCYSREEVNAVAPKDQDYLVVGLGDELGLYDLEKKGETKKRKRRSDFEEDHEVSVVPRKHRNSNKVLVLSGFDEPEDTA